MKKMRTLTLLCLALALAACKPQASSGTAEAPIATVNGTPITREFFNFYLRGISQGKDPAELSQQQREQALDNLVRAQVIAQQAVKDGLTSDPDTAEQVRDLQEMARLQALQQAVTQKFLKDTKPTDADLHKEYDAQVAMLPKNEYHIAHILVGSQDEAIHVIEELDKAHGANFSALALQYSTDPSKDKGGDIGWIAPNQDIRPITDAVASLSPGQYSHVPVQTKYGWHVVKLLETRPFNVPAFDTVKERVSQGVISQKYKAYIEGLVSKAQIDKKI
ncbi:MAG TPA: peptidylprolyl isomerase [Steroidobacteraceae bacterium]|nr:peptidylprolyl isomerase [Steroidobacteraceae bacterium]